MINLAYKLNSPTTVTGTENKTEPMNLVSCCLFSKHGTSLIKEDVIVVAIVIASVIILLHMK